ncbi:putative PMR5 domain, trichome birefringence-like family [Helianthus debilis subsp. tardiflorus]
MKGTERLQKVVHGYHSVGFMLVMVVMMVVVYLYGDNNSSTEISFEVTEILEDHSFEGCDFFSGSWVYDNTSRPLYKERQCSFMVDDYSCEKFGRKDFQYQFWKWQPHGCHLPRQ